MVSPKAPQKPTTRKWSTTRKLFISLVTMCGVWLAVAWTQIHLLSDEVHRQTLNSHHPMIHEPRRTEELPDFTDDKVEKEAREARKRKILNRFPGAHIVGGEQPIVLPTPEPPVLFKPIPGRTVILSLDDEVRAQLTPTATMTTKPRLLSYIHDDLEADPESVPYIHTKHQHYHKTHHKRAQEYILDAFVDWRRQIASGRNYTKEESFEGQPWREIKDQKLCLPQYDWQTKYFPVCNSIHENIRIADGLAAAASTVKYINTGGYRNVWDILLPKEGGKSFQQYALKTLKYEREYYQIQFERHRMDALTSAQLMASPNILNVYSQCGTTAIYELAAGGDLEDYIKQNPKLEPEEKVQLAHQITSALADAHNWQKEGHAWFAHTDIATRQFVRVNASTTLFQLTDFNRARMLLKNHVTHKPCGFLFRNAHELTRSPEEFDRNHVQTEKIDVYSLGNVLYELLTGHPIYQPNEDDPKAFVEKLRKGWRPEIGEEWENHKDQLILDLVTAIRQCWVQDPILRASARQIQQHLQEAMNKEEYEE